MSEVQKAIFGSPNKLLKIGQIEIECYVLENGKRVFSGRGMQEAVGLVKKGQTSHGAILKGFLARDYIKPLINNDFARAINEPIQFTRPGRGGRPANALEATLLIDLCDIISKAYELELLPESQTPLYHTARIITSSFAKTGIISAIDEVTGYQAVREKNAIQQILNKFLQKETRKWSKTFPDEFWHKLIRVKGYPTYTAMKRPAYVGHWVNDIVYSRLAPELMNKLKEINPRESTTGRRQNKHHQHLTTDFGIPELKEHLTKVMVLMDASPSDRIFKSLLNRSLPVYNQTKPLPFDDIFEDNKK